MNKKRKQLLNFSINFKAVWMLGEQDEAQTPSSGDTQHHCFIGNKIAEQAAWLNCGVSARQCVTKSHYLCINPRWKSWAGLTVKRKCHLQTANLCSAAPEELGAGMLLHRCSCANSPKSTCTLRKWEGWKGLVYIERPSTHTRDVLACKVVCIKVYGICVGVHACACVGADLRATPKTIRQSALCEPDISLDTRHLLWLIGSHVPLSCPEQFCSVPSFPKFGPCSTCQPSQIERQEENEGQ